MKKISTIIADDEVLARNVILNHVAKLDRLQVVAVCADGLEVYNAIKNSNPDLVFLDIQMPQLTGIELLRTLKKPPAVILTTAYSEFALEGYELNVIDYLLKPISFERLLKAVDKYETWINPQHVPPRLVQPVQAPQADGFIYVKSEKRMVRILLKDILFIEGLKDYVKIHTIEKQIITYQTLTFFEEKLPAGQFLRVHRSYIVALGGISSFSALELRIGRKVIPIGSTYAREVGKRLQG